MVNTAAGEYVCLLSDASAREIAKNGCKVGPLREGVHTKPIMEAEEPSIHG